MQVVRERKAVWDLARLEVALERLRTLELILVGMNQAVRHYWAIEGDPWAGEVGQARQRDLEQGAVLAQEVHWLIAAMVTGENRALLVDETLREALGQALGSQTGW
jgi:hypothetical protein